MLGVLLIKECFCPIVSLSIIKYQNIRSLSTFGCHETFKIIHLILAFFSMQCMREDWVMISSSFLFPPCFMSYHGQFLHATLTCWRLKRKSGVRSYNNYFYPSKILYKNWITRENAYLCIKRVDIILEYPFIFRITYNMI